MKKFSYVLITLFGLVLAAIIVTWSQLDISSKVNALEPAAGETPQQAQQQPTAVVPNPPANVTPAMPIPAQQAAAQAATPPMTAATTTPAPVAASANAPATPTTTTSGAPTDLSSAMQTSAFLKKLSFPLTEQQMIEFARAAIKVQKINAKWDVQIASAENDQMAIEYNNLAVEEIEHSLKNIPNLTLAQYNELTQLTATDKEFNAIYQAYKQLVTEGAFGAAPTGGTIPAKAASSSATSTSVPAAQPPATPAPAPAPAAPAPSAVKPSSGSVNSGTAPAPQGSPAPRYSQPATR